MLLEILSERISLDLFAIIEKLYISMIYGHHIKEKSRPKIKSQHFRPSKFREKNFGRISKKPRDVIGV